MDYGLTPSVAWKLQLEYQSHWRWWDFASCWLWPFHRKTFFQTLGFPWLANACLLSPPVNRKNDGLLFGVQREIEWTLYLFIIASAKQKLAITKHVAVKHLSGSFTVCFWVMPMVAITSVVRHTFIFKLSVTWCYFFQ